MKTNCAVYLHEDTDFSIQYHEISKTATYVVVVSGGQHFSFTAQPGKLLALFRALETVVLEGEGIEHLHLGLESDEIDELTGAARLNEAGEVELPAPGPFRLEVE